MSDTAAINKIENNTYDEEFLLNLTQKKYFVFRYFINDVGYRRLIFWNSQAVLPSDKILDSKDSTGFLQLQNGFYVWRKSQSSSAVTIAMIPVKWQYVVTNEHLENAFTTGKDIAANYDISLQPKTAAVKSINGNNLFNYEHDVNFQSWAIPDVQAWAMLMLGLTRDAIVSATREWFTAEGGISHEMEVALSTLPNVWSKTPLHKS